MSNCKHGFGQGECTFCRENTEKKNMYFVPQLISKINNNEPYGLILSYPDTSGMINVMWRSEDNYIERVNDECTGTCYVKQLSTPEQNRLKIDFRNIAIDKGALFIPRCPLTRRETTEIGESNCWSCGKGTKLSYNRGSIGCNKCTTYVCVCGHCMCDFPGGMVIGEGRKKKYMPPKKHSSFNVETRREYVKIVKAFIRLN